MESTREAPDALKIGVPLVVGAVLGLLGAVLPGATSDAPTFLAWTATVAAPIGAWLGARGVRLFPTALVVPGTWGLAMIWLGLELERTLPRPLGGGLIVLALFVAGLGLGRLLGTVVWAPVLLLVLGLVGAPLGWDLGQGTRAGSDPTRGTPRLTRLALECSPVGLALECAGWDWTHVDRDVYERSGVEFAPRHPHRVRRSGLAVSLASGLLLAAGVLIARRRTGNQAGT